MFLIVREACPCSAQHVSGHQVCSLVFIWEDITFCGDVSGELQDGRAHVWGSARFCQNVQGFLGNRAFSVVFLLLFRICIRQLCIPDFLGPVEYCCNIENEEARSNWKQMTRLVTLWTTAEIIVNIPLLSFLSCSLVILVRTRPYANFVTWYTK